jgi:hypothetical protein
VVARAFTAGLAVVSAIAALGIWIVRPDPTPEATPELASEVQPVRSTGRPPTREDLIGAICTGFLANATCVHDLMPLYRACGLDGAHPRTTACAAEVRRVRRTATKRSVAR